MFQAISLESDADDAKLLAFSALSLVAGVKREEKADLELTAIIEPIAWPEATTSRTRNADRAVPVCGWKRWKNMHSGDDHVRSAAHCGDSAAGATRLVKPGGIIGR